MKFQNAASLENHLKGGKEQLSSGYLVAIASDFERRALLQKIVEILKHNHPGSIVSSMEGSGMSQILSELNTRNLFGEAKIVVCDQAEKFKKPELEELANYFLKPSSFAYLVMGGSHFKNFEEFYPKVKKELVILDLSDEKPWDKQKRILQELHEMAKERGKRMSSDATALLIQYHGNDGAILQQELEKIMTYIGDKSQVDKEDVQTICSSSVSSTSWQVSEQLVWWGVTSGLSKNLDVGYFLGLIGQVRHHLQMGLQIAILLEDGANFGEIAKAFPSLKENVLQKYCQKAVDLKADYFRLGLSLLFEVEQRIKGSYTDPLLLWEMFMMKMLSFKDLNDQEKTYFMAASQPS